MTASGPIHNSLSRPALHQVQDSWSPYSLASTATRARLRQIWEWAGFDYDLASKLRYESDMMLLRTRCALSFKYRRQIRNLRSRNNLQVHLGCGNALLGGWINLDCYPPPRQVGIDIMTLDMRRGLPFANDSVTAVFSEHFLEHLPFETVRRTLVPEIFRVLAPSGRVRIGVPNGEYFIDQYISYRSGNLDPLFEAQRLGKTPMNMLNEISHSYGHYFVYDLETLSKILTEAGFVAVRRREAFATDFEEFKGKDRVDPWRNAMTLYVEAEAPPRR